MAEILKLDECKKLGVATKKPIPTGVYEFKGKKVINTIEGFAYAVDGNTHYVLEGIKGEIWPIEKKIFSETYEFDNDNIVKKDDVQNDDFSNDGFVASVVETVNLLNNDAAKKRGFTETIENLFKNKQI